MTFNRPDAHNAISLAMVVELYGVLEAIAERSDVRVVVLTGAGDRFFNPGAELGQSQVDQAPTAFPDPRTMHSCVLLHEMPQVTLAAVNGSVAGAGFGWLAACDLRVASSTAMFATAFLDVGVAGDLGVPWSLERIVGGARMRELLFLRGKFDAHRALEIGLVSEVFPSERFRADVAAVVDRLRNAPPRALRTMKANMLDAERLSFADFVDLETRRHVDLVTGPEFRAGVETFLRSRGARPRR